MSTSTTQATNPSLYKSLPSDVRADFAPISRTAFIPNVLIMNPSIPTRTAGEFIAYLKATPAT